VKEVFTCASRSLTDVAGHAGRAPTRFGELRGMLDEAQIVTVLFGERFMLKRWMLVRECSRLQ